MNGFGNISFGKEDIPSLNEGIDISNLALTPKEGFVLSRVDGRTSLAEISSISGVSLDEIFQIFLKLHEKNVVSFKIPDSKKIKGKQKTKISILKQLEEDDNYESLRGIPRDDRKRILMTEEDMERLNYYELLGVPRNVLEDRLKKAYFNLTKEFHPDRFFGRELGIYKKKLERIFQKITEAYEVLSDRDKRRSYDATFFPTGAGKGKSGKSEEKPLRSKTLIEKLAEAKKYYNLGEIEYNKGNVISASSYFNIAMSYDPSNQQYRTAFEKTKPMLDKKRAKSKFDEALKKQEFGDYDNAINLLTEAVELDPNVGEYNYNLAKLLLTHKNDYVKSKEFCLKAVETMGEDPEVRITMGKIYKRAGLMKNAVREFKLALKLDKENKTAKMELEEIS